MALYKKAMPPSATRCVSGVGHCKVDNPLQGLGYFFSSTIVWLCLRWFETASYLDAKCPNTLLVGLVMDT
jgi:hypothetical protein